MLPHSSFGDRKCCGCLNGIIRGDHADIVCNECDSIIRTVPSADLSQRLTEMELTLDVWCSVCPQCATVKILAGFSKILAFTCGGCGGVVKLSDDPKSTISSDGLESTHWHEPVDETGPTQSAQ